MATSELHYKPDVPLKNTTLTVNVVVTPTRQYRMRLWVGTRLLYLAALVLGCAAEINAEFGGKSP